MNRNHLALFRAVAEAGSVTRAAESLRISQPAVSSQLAQLESHIGDPLFDRLPRGVRLTPLGEELYGYAKRLGDIEREAHKAVEEHRGLRRGRLAIGASTSIGSYFLPGVLGAMARRYPALELSLSISNTEEIQQALADGRVDLGLTEGFADEGRFDITVFRQDELQLIAPAGHPLTEQTEVRLEQVLAFPLLAREPGSGTRAVLEQELARRGLPLTPALSLGSSEALKRGVLAGLGLAFVSELTIVLELVHGLLETVPVSDFEILRPLHLLKPPGRSISHAAAEFCSLLGV